MIRTFVSAVFSSIVVLLMTTSINAALEEDLLFYFSFDGIKNQAIIDKSQNGLDAEIIENAKVAKGKYGDAIHITDDGLDCVNIPFQEILNVTDEITMMAWVYYPEAWESKKMHWFDKSSHSLKRWLSYGMGSIDIGS